MNDDPEFTRKMKRAYLAYAVWLSAVLIAAGVALAWYRHVEDLTWQALGSRLNETPVTTDDPE